MNGKPAIDQGGLAARSIGAALDWLTRIECLFAVVCLCVSAGALVVDITVREVFHVGLFGSLRVAVYATALAALSGFAICVATGTHLRITSFDHLMPARWQPFVARAGNLVAFGICMFFAYWSLFYVRQTFRIGETDPSLRMAVWPMQSILIWMFLSGGVRYLAYSIFPQLQPPEAEPAS